MDSIIRTLAWVFCVLTVCCCAGKNSTTAENDSSQEISALTDKYDFLASGASSALSKEQTSCVGKINRFSFDLAERLEKVKGNDSFAFSPVSVSYVLGMLANGADGATREEILKVLGGDFNDIQAANAFFRDLIVLLGGGAGTGEVLETANLVLADGSFPIRDSYAESVKNFYDALVANLDFSNPGNAAGSINAKVSERTYGVISQAVTEQDLASASCILLNTLYFKADWARQFPAELTAKRAFTNTSGAKRQVEMMANSFYGEVGYAEAEGYRTLSLPLGSDGTAGNFLCSFILPDDGVSLSLVMGKLASDNWRPSVVFPKEVNMVSVRIPKFKVSLTERFNEILGDAGMVSAFSPSADFSNLSTTPSMLALFKHVCSLSMDESGLEASAASTAVLMATGIDGPEVVKYFHADHPFLFVISEKTTGAFLFVGCYK